MQGVVDWVGVDTDSSLSHTIYAVGKNSSRVFKFPRGAVPGDDDFEGILG